MYTTSTMERGYSIADRVDLTYVPVWTWEEIRNREELISRLNPQLLDVLDKEYVLDSIRKADVLLFEYDDNRTIQVLVTTDVRTQRPYAFLFIHVLLSAVKGRGAVLLNELQKWTADVTKRFRHVFGAIFLRCHQEKVYEYYKEHGFTYMGIDPAYDLFKNRPLTMKWVP